MRGALSNEVQKELIGASFLDRGEEPVKIWNPVLEFQNFELLWMPVDVCFTGALRANGGAHIHVAFQPFTFVAAGGRNVMLFLDEDPALDRRLYYTPGA